MSRRAARCTQADIVRAVKGAEKAGLSVARVEVDRDGKIMVIPGIPKPPPSSDRIRPEQDVPDDSRWEDVW